MQPVQEIHPDTDGCNRECHEQHIHTGTDLQLKHALEKADNKDHNDDFGDLILEIVKGMDLKKRSIGFRAAGDVDLGDEELVHPEAENQQYSRYQEQVDRSDDPEKQPAVAHREGRECNGAEEGINYLQPSCNEQDDRADGPEYHCQDNDQARTPECTFQPSLDKALFIRGLDTLGFSLFVSVLVFHYEEMGVQEIKNR